jgi:hypothetical protein
MMAVANSSETLVYIYLPTRRHIPEDWNTHQQDDVGKTLVRGVYVLSAQR